MKKIIIVINKLLLKNFSGICKTHTTKENPEI